METLTNTENFQGYIKEDTDFFLTKITIFVLKSKAIQIH